MFSCPWHFVRQNPAEAAQFIAKEWKVDQPLAEELYRSMLPAYSKDGGMDEKGSLSSHLEI